MSNISVSVKHVNVPPEYCYHVRLNSNTFFLRDLEEYFNCDSIYSTNLDEDVIAGTPLTGLHKFGEFDAFVHNQIKSGYMSFYFKSKQDWIDLNLQIDNIKVAKIDKVQLQLYRFNVGHATWYLETSYKYKNDTELVGYESYLASIEKDINNLEKHNDFLESIGESKSLNYLLYGPPGVGKTTLIRTLASKYNLPVFIVNATGINCQYLPRVMNPVVSGTNENQQKILLFEDFDRFLEDDKIDTMMSTILNSMDGFDDKGKVIRVFTGNNCHKIFSNPALINRMVHKFKFELPTIDMFRHKLQRLLSYHQSYDQELAERYLALVIEKKNSCNLTLRPFVGYTLRYLFDDDYLNKLIENIEEL
jgi:hypothetical protein